MIEKVTPSIHAQLLSELDTIVNLTTAQEEEEYRQSNPPDLILFRAELTRKRNKQREYDKAYYYRQKEKEVIE